MTSPSAQRIEQLENELAELLDTCVQLTHEQNELTQEIIEKHFEIRTLRSLNTQKGTDHALPFPQYDTYF